MRSFSADAQLAARQTWELEIAGRRFAARPVSAEQVLVFELLAKGLPPLLYWRAFQELLRLAFPRRLSFLWKGDPVRLFAALPDDVKAKARDSFFLYLPGVPTGTPNGLLLEIPGRT